MSAGAALPGADARRAGRARSVAFPECFYRVPAAVLLLCAAAALPVRSGAETVPANAIGSDRNTGERTAELYPSPPDKPAGFRAIAGNERVVLAWNDAEDASIQGWEYRRKETGHAYTGWLPVPRSDASTTSHTVTGLQNGVEYSFRLRAYNSIGTGYVSDERSATPMPTAPGKPTGFSVEPGNRKATLSWNDPGDNTIAGWQFAYKTVGAYGNWTEMAGSSARTVQHVVSMLENNIVHTFKIRAVNDIGDGLESDEVSATPFARIPGKPAGFLALTGDGRVELSWENPDDSSITKWQYAYRTTGDFGDWTDIPGSGAATTGHTVVELSNGTPYTFKLRAVNDIGHGPESNEVSATPLSIPAKPSGFTAKPGDAQVTLGWDNPLNAAVTGWQYSFRTSGEYGDWTDIPGSNAATTRHVVTGLANGVAHTFRLRAVNASGYGRESDGIGVTPRPVPAKPSGFRAEAGNTQVRLVWTDPGDNSISGWQYAYKTTGDYGEWTDIAGSNATTTRHTVTALTNDTVHTFKIRAVNGSGAGPESDETSSTPQPAVPAKPMGFKAEPGDGEVALEWDNPDDSSIEGWQYKVRASDGGYKPEWENIPGSDASTVKHVVKGLENGRPYTFKIRAVNSVNGYESDERSATPRSLRPAAPTGLRAEAGDGRVTLTWDDPGDATITGWQYSAGTTGGSGEWMDIPGSDAATVRYAVAGLQNGAQYTFRLRAVNEWGEGDESGDVSATPISVPAKPSGLTATPGDGQVRLDWDDPGNLTITGWEYRLAATGPYGAWTGIAGSSAETTRHTLTGLANGTAYRFRVRAVNASGSGPESDETTTVPSPAPAKPAGLTATPGRGWVLLEWEDPNDPAITGWEYKQRRAGGEFDESWTPIPDINAATARHRVTGLEIGVSYGFKLRAAAGNRRGAESVEATATLPPVPAKPRGLAATAGDGAVLLEWTALHDPSVTLWQYRYRAEGGYSEWTGIPGSSAATGSYRVGGLDNGTAYGFRIRAWNSSGPGLESEEVTAVPLSAPAAPQGFTATPGDGTVLLEWDETNDLEVTGWEYNRRRADGPFEEGWTYILGSRAATSRHTVIGLENGVPHTFRLRAVAGDRIGRESEDATAMPTAGLPAAPENLRARAGDRQVQLLWDDPGNPAITGWQFRYRTTGVFTGWRDIPGSTATLTNHAVSGLANDVVHYFRIRARTASGSGPPSESARALPEPGKPGKPTGLKAFPGDGQVLLTWDAVSDPALHWEYVRWVEDTGVCRRGSNAWQDVGDWATTRYTVTGLANGAAYCFQVRVARGDDPGPGSDPVSATPRVTAKPMERRAARAVLSSLAARLAAGAEAVVGARFSADRVAPRLLLAGRNVPIPAPIGEERTQYRPAGGQQPTVIGMDGRDALRDSAFQLTLGPPDGGSGLRWSLWHRGELKVFQGSADERTRFGGRLLSAWFGLDVRRDKHSLAGVAVAHSKGEVAYAAGATSGVIKTAIDSVHPYWQRQFDDGQTVWLTLGGGRGTIENKTSGRGAEIAEARMATVSARFRGSLPTLLGIRLSASGAVGFARLQTAGKARTAVSALSASSDRQSLDLQAALEEGGTSGFTSLSLRRDGGDGMRGLGLELSSAVRSPLPASPGHVDIRARWLGRHSEREYREFGLTVTARRPAGAGGRGPSWSLAATHGAPDGGSGETDRLWADDTPKHGGDTPALALNLRAGWQFVSHRTIFKPHAALGLAGSAASRLTLGIDMGPSPGPVLKLAAERRTPEAGKPEHRVSAAMQFRF